MAIDLLKDRGAPFDSQRFTLRELAPPPTSKLDDDGLVMFLQHCAAEGAAVLVHPWDMMGGERTRRFMMAWTVSMPMETQLAMVAMILGGAFDRIPRSLKICFAHGGGSFAFLLGRLENAWHHGPTVKGNSQHPPSYYCDRFYLDTAVFSHDALEMLVKTVGEDRVVLGSDYPFPLGETEPGSLIRSMNVPPGVQEDLLFRTACNWLNVTPEQFE